MFMIFLITLQIMMIMIDRADQLNIHFAPKLLKMSSIAKGNLKL